MNRSLFIIFATIALDAIGIGLIFPILPLLLQDMTHSTHISIYMGYIGQSLCYHAIYLLSFIRCVK